MPIIAKIKKEQSNLEQILVNVAQDYYNDRKPGGCLFAEFPDFCYDLNGSCNELNRLGASKNCRYDRPTIGFAYSLRFHLKRFNQWINFIDGFIKSLNGNEVKRINVFDVGSGTGSVEWAWNIVLWARRNLGLWNPELNIFSIDNSAFMIEYNRLLWDKFIYSYSNELSHMDWDFSINTKSTNESKINSSYNILQLSYYFDSSDLSTTSGVAAAKDNIFTMQKILNIHRVFSLNSPKKRDAKSKIWSLKTHPEIVLKKKQYVFTNVKPNTIDAFSKKITCPSLDPQSLAFFWQDYVDHKNDANNPSILDYTLIK